MTQQTWDCSQARISLGVYVLGAIDPAERALVDAHLASCRECRDELAGLASLPALLARVDQEELDRIDVDHDGAQPEADQADEPAEGLIGAVLDLAAARRRHNRWRSVAAAAAVVAVAGGAAGAVAATQSDHNVAIYVPSTGPLETAQATTPGGISADVYYATKPWGTLVNTSVRGIPMGTTCQLWVIYPDGTRVLAGSWMTAGDEGTITYPSSVPPDSQQISNFQITAGAKTLITVKAS